MWPLSTDTIYGMRPLLYGQCGECFSEGWLLHVLPCFDISHFDDSSGLQCHVWRHGAVAALLPRADNDG